MDDHQLSDQLDKAACVLAPIYRLNGWTFMGCSKYGVTEQDIRQVLGELALAMFTGKQSNVVATARLRLQKDDLSPTGVKVLLEVHA